MPARPLTAFAAVALATLALWAALRVPNGSQPAPAPPVDAPRGAQGAGPADPGATAARRALTPTVAPTAPVSASAAVEGRVLDGLGQPVAGAEVTFQPLLAIGVEGTERDEPSASRVTGDDDGRFRLVVPPGRPGVLILAHRDFPPRVARADLEVAVGETRSVGDLVLHSAPGVIVWVRTDGRGVPGARVSLAPAMVEVSLPTPARDLSERTAVTDGDGRALLYGVGAGAYSIRVEAAQVATHEVAHLQPGAASSAPVVVIDLAPGHVIRGRLVAPDRGNLGVATVRAEAVGGGITLVGAVAPSGDFRIAGAAAGRYRVTADSTRFGAIEAELMVPGEAPNLHFAPGGAIAGIVVARVGQSPIPGAEVRAVPEDGWPLQRAGRSVVPSAFAGPDGRFVIDGLPEGRFHVGAASDGFVATRSHPTPTGTADLRLQLDAGLTAVGIALDAEGRPAHAARVRLVADDHEDTGYARWKRAVTGSATREATPDATGHFELRGIAPGQHRLAIDCPGHAPWLSQVLAGDAGTRLDLGSITLAPGARVHGVAIAADGSPAATATVCLDGLSPRGTSRQVRTDQRGRFEFGELAGGDYELFYHYPERDGPLASSTTRTRTLQRVHVDRGASATVTLAPK
ncbi:MAG: carboxypeptidase regulatory-like domain-containing protein [Phycisphaerales bacterium]|nr:carboxypeptidase regulatory-like domain-containing protein [Phycisphaerales bacterium]